jgi:hypothetical protein
MIGPTDFLHPSPAPHVKTLQVFRNVVLEKDKQGICFHTLNTRIEAEASILV